MKHHALANEVAVSCVETLALHDPYVAVLKCACMCLMMTVATAHWSGHARVVHMHATLQGPAPRGMTMTLPSSQHFSRWEVRS